MRAAIGPCHCGHLWAPTQTKALTPIGAWQDAILNACIGPTKKPAPRTVATFNSRLRSFRENWQRTTSKLRHWVCVASETTLRTLHRAHDRPKE
eukprot:scaffold315080_cov31-Tisochrysis_lutea.AAC.3